MQWEGKPILRCSSRIVVGIPAFEAFRAERDPVGPPPIINRSESTELTLCFQACFSWVFSFRLVLDFRGLNEKKEKVRDCLLDFPLAQRFTEGAAFWTVEKTDL